MFQFEQKRKIISTEKKNHFEVNSRNINHLLKIIDTLWIEFYCQIKYFNSP
jgi:hypothetical protein